MRRKDYICSDDRAYLLLDPIAAAFCRACPATDGGGQRGVEGTCARCKDVNALREVVIYGERCFDKRMAQMLKPSPQQLERDKLPQVIPAGPNVLAIAAWLYENLYGKKREKRLARKKALEKVRKQEAELQERWDSLEKK